VLGKAIEFNNEVKQLIKKFEYKTRETIEVSDALE
jgi:hypothetical protein